MLHQVALWQEQYPDDNFDFIPATTATDDEIETIIGTKGDSRTKDYDDEVVLPTMHVKFLLRLKGDHSHNTEAVEKLCYPGGHKLGHTFLANTLFVQAALHGFRICPNIGHTPKDVMDEMVNHFLRRWSPNILMTSWGKRQSR